MGALQTSLSNIQRPVGVLQLHPRARKDKLGCVNSSSSNLPKSDQTIGSHSVSEDWVLVQQAIAGDSSSQDRLFGAHATRFYRTAFAVLRNKEDAEDAVQDGLFRAYTKLRSFQGRSTFSTWLTRIVINSALMTRRRKGTRPAASLDEIPDIQEGWVAYQIVDTRPDPEEICSISEINELVEGEIQRLPAAVQMAFRLHEVDGLSAAESMRALGIRKNAFKSRILRARRKLTQTLQRPLQAPTQIVMAVEARRSKRRGHRRLTVDLVASRAIMFGPASPAQT